MRQAESLPKVCTHAPRDAEELFELFEGSRNVS